MDLAAKTSTIAAWVAAARSARVCSSSPPACSAAFTRVSTAVFRPLKLKSRSPLCSMGRGSSKRVASPLPASFDSAGPPG